MADTLRFGRAGCRMDAERGQGRMPCHVLLGPRIAVVTDFPLSPLCL